MLEKFLEVVDKPEEFVKFCSKSDICGLLALFDEELEGSSVVAKMFYDVEPYEYIRECWVIQKDGNYHCVSFPIYVYDWERDINNADVEPVMLEEITTTKVKYI